MILAAFHDFPGLENGLTKFHDFPGRVVTLFRTYSAASNSLPPELHDISDTNTFSTIIPKLKGRNSVDSANYSGMGISLSLILIKLFDHIVLE